MFVCKNCGRGSHSKLGKCINCGEFGTYEEVYDELEESHGKILNENETIYKDELNIGNTELQRVIGKTIKPGGIYLLAGEPGIGKSTICLEIIKSLETSAIGYFSGEETAKQIKDRVTRIGNILEIDIFHGTILEDILETINSKNYKLIIIDSIQTIYSNKNQSVAGSINQIKYCTEKISEYCKKNYISCIIIGHITKGGEIAGPKYLEHIVDVVLYLEGERFSQLRLLKGLKNRFNSTDDIGIFEMKENGFKTATNINENLINKNSEIGTTLSIGIDNGRGIIVKIETLLNKTKYKFPQRNALGISTNRLDMIIAVIERYLKINLGAFDIFVNIPGDMKFFDSGLDIAIAGGLLSQYYNIPANNAFFIGELSLTGQIGQTKFHDKRIREIIKGYEINDHKNIKNIFDLGKLFK